MYRVLIVPGARLAEVIVLTHVSMCERRIRPIGTSPKVACRTARFMASVVVDSHTCRADQSA